MSQVIQNAVFPSVMRDKLCSVRWRQAAISAVRALVIAVSVLLTAMIVSMLVDWCFTLFDTRVRILLTMGSLSLCVIALLFTGVRPVVKAFGWTRAAGSVDEQIPLMEERWQTVASFAESGRQPVSESARAMLAQVTSEAVAMSMLVRPRQVIRSRSLRRSGSALAFVSAALFGFMLINLPQTSVLMQRFWSPTWNISATQLQSVTGDVIVPRGQSIEIVTRMNGLQRDSARMLMNFETDSMPSELLELKPVADTPGMLSVAIDVDESFQYQVQAGDGRTEWHSVTAIDFPALSEIRLMVTPPDYVDEPVTEKTLIPGRLRAIQGSQFELAMKPRQELKSLTLVLTLPDDSDADVPLPPPTSTVAANNNPTVVAPISDTEASEAKSVQTMLTLTRADDGWYHFETQLVEDFTLSPMLLSPHGLTNEHPRVCRIEVIADKAPVARIVSPNEDTAVNPDESIEIKFEAHDDHGIATAELVIYDAETKDGEEPKILAVKEIPLGDQQQQKHVMGKTELNLKEFGLEEGSSISYAIRVTDNRLLEMDPESGQNRLTASTEASTDSEPQTKNEEQTSSESGSMNDEPEGSEKESSDAGNANKLAMSDQKSNTGEPERPLPANADGTPRPLESPTGASTKDAVSETIPDSEVPENSNPDAETPDNLIADKGSRASENGVNASQDPAEATSDLPTSTAASVEKQPVNRTEEETALTVADPSDSEISNLKSQIPSSSAENSDTSNPKSPASNSSVANSSIPDLKSQNSNPTDSNPGATKSQISNLKSEISSPQQSQNPPSKVAMNGQQSEAGQQQETDRRKLRISERLDAEAERSKDQKTDVNPMRERVVQIDKLLEVIETKLNALYRHVGEEAHRGDGFKELDIRLGDVESFITELNTETRDSAFEFVGLQMVDIGSSHVTPARDAVFVAIRKPDSGADVHSEEALHHVVSARELLQALLRKYDSVAQEQELAKKLDEAVKMYTVYVEGTQQLLREAQQNFDPLKLQREMAVLEVDQAYLDRLAEVTRMRRDMMSELAKILGDDPRLRARYLDLIKRRRASLRSQLAELAGQQDQIAQEVSGWINVSENQRDNYWLQVSDLRLDLPKELAKESQQFADRIEKQMPLVLNPSQGTPALAIQLAQQIALDVRRCDFGVREIRKAGGKATESSDLSESAGDLVFRIGELAAALDQLNFEGEDLDGVADFVQLRLAESRVLADQADTWAETATSIERKRYSGLAHVDQQQITIATEILRMEMLNIEADLAGQFDDEPMPQELVNLTQELLRTMESITFNQSSAAFALSRDRIEPGAAQQELAMIGFEEAGKILDQLRRKTIEVLDRQEVQDPSIADLDDPTLDEFLANLEREPDIEAQLGIPNRPRNIRVIQESMQWTQNGDNMLGTSGNAAMARVQQQMKQRLNAAGENDKKQEPPEAREMTEEDEKQLAQSKDMQEMLKSQMQRTMKELDARAGDPSQSEAQRRSMKEMSQRMSKALEEMKDGQVPEKLWQRMVEADQAKAALEALAKGESLPDDQWNKLMSTLDDGLGQVGGRTPPEDYRKAIEQYQDRIRELTGAGASE